MLHSYVMSEELVCAHCGGRFSRQSPMGPKPRFCSASHRQRAHERRKRDAEIADVVARMSPISKAAEQLSASTMSPMLDSISKVATANLAARMSPISKAAEQLSASTMSPMLDSISKVATANLAAQMSPISKAAEQLGASTMSPISKFADQISASTMSPIIDSMTKIATESLAAQMSPISKIAEQISASTMSPMLDAISQMATNDLIGSHSELAKRLEAVDPELWRSLVDRATAEEAEQDEDSQLVNAATADAVAGAVLVLVLYVLALVAARQVVSNVAALKMIFDGIDYEVGRHPAVGGFAFLWGFFGPSIIRALRNDGTPKDGEDS